MQELASRGLLILLLVLVCGSSGGAVTVIKPHRQPPH
jgi:hypothetical protein